MSGYGYRHPGPLSRKCMYMGEGWRLVGDNGNCHRLKEPIPPSFSGRVGGSVLPKGAKTARGRCNLRGPPALAIPSRRQPNIRPPNASMLRALLPFRLCDQGAAAFLCRSTRTAPIIVTVVNARNYTAHLLSHASARRASRFHHPPCLQDPRCVSPPWQGYSN